MAKAFDSNEWKASIGIGCASKYLSESWKEVTPELIKMAFKYAGFKKAFHSSLGETSDLRSFENIIEYDTIHDGIPEALCIQL